MSRKKQGKLVEGIITSDAVQQVGRFSHRLRYTLLLVGSAILVLGGISYALYASHGRIHLTHSQEPLTRQQQLMEAITAAKLQLKKAKTPAQIAQANETLGAAYSVAGQQDSAIAAYNAAITADASVKITVLDPLGYAYAVTGQRDKAIASYQELVQLLQVQQLPADHVANVYNGGGVGKYQQYIMTLQAGGTL